MVRKCKCGKKTPSPASFYCTACRKEQAANNKAKQAGEAQFLLDVYIELVSLGSDNEKLMKRLKAMVRA